MVQVSVAVITYNMQDYLRQLLDSILVQKVNFDYEIIIDDDCSLDNSRQIILDYQKRYPDIVKPSLRDKNVGGSKNMYGVLQKCSGKYIAILEGDDWWEDDSKLQYQYDFMESHSEHIGMCCNSWCDHGLEAEYSQKMRNREEPRIYTYNDFMNRSFHDRLPSSTDTWFFRNFIKDGGDYSLIYKAHNMIWDQSLILIMYGKGNIYADSKLVSHHRSVVKKEGTNYQSVIVKKNMLYSDSLMYQAMEEYIENTLHRECKPFYLVRGDVWIDAKFRSLITKNKEDKQITNKIYKNQKRKLMLYKLFIQKSIDIIGRKLNIT